MLGWMDDHEDEGGKPAQTGSAVHVGVAEFHRLQGQTLAIRKKGAWDAINATMHKFPLADPTEVRLFLTPYMDDPRNINVECYAIEQEVEFTLDPHPEDKTQELIYVNGTLDQLRISNDRRTAEVWDLKTGRKTGWELLHDHAIQLAAYTLGARQRFGTEVVPGGIIRNYGYRARSADSASPDDVFWPALFQVDDIPLILEPVQLAVANIRNGNAVFGTGPHCTYCEFGGLQGCLAHYHGLHSTVEKG